MPIVKISFIGHNRTYTTGIQNFLKIAGIPMTDAEITKAVNKVLNTLGAPTE